MSEAVVAFAPEVVAAIVGHLNEDHADDALRICRTVGGLADATSARTTGVDPDGIDFEVATPAGPRAVRIPWGRRLTARAEVRAEVVRLHDLARAWPAPPAVSPG